MPTRSSQSVQTVYCHFSVGIFKITADESFILSCDRVSAPLDSQHVLCSENSENFESSEVSGDSQILTPRDIPNRPTLLGLACAQLTDYFMGTRQQFDLPLRWEGSAFRQRVWQALCHIPYGETRSYGEIAAAVGQPKAARAVGQANHHNPFLIIVPCHRVIGQSGTLVGYGAGLALKAWLLQHEQAHSPYLNLPKNNG